MKTLFEALRVDHDRQRDLISKLLATSGDTEERQRLFLDLKSELQAHALAEERYLYRFMMGYDATMEEARHSVAEHKDLDDYVEQLTATDASSPAWMATAKKLAHRLEHHLEEEEREVFQVAGKVMPDAQKTGVVDEYRAFKQEHAAL